MRPIETFRMPKSIIDVVGKQWDGEYVVHELNAREYLQAQSKATSFMIEETAQLNKNLPEAEQTKWNGIIPEDVMTLHIVCKSVTLNGVELDPKTSLPSKIWETLSWKSLPTNTTSKDEFEALFLSSQKKDHATSPT
jgi:Cdc6-like AAA superfamily ATPase